MDNDKKYLIVYNPLVSTAVMLLITCMISSSTTSYMCLLFGNGFVLVCIFCMFARILINNKELDTQQSIITLSPVMLLSAIVVWFLTLNVYKQSRILDGHIGNNYYTFRNIYIVLLFIMLSIIHPIISQSKISTIESLSIFLMAIFLGMCVNILRVILTQFITDGFQGDIIKI